MNAAALSGRAPLPSAPAPSRATIADTRHVAVGVEFLIEAAGGEAAIIRLASSRLARVFRDASAIEATEALAFALVELAPEAIEQLASAGPAAISAAASALYSGMRL